MSLIRKGDAAYGFWVAIGVLAALAAWNFLDRKVISKTAFAE